MMGRLVRIVEMALAAILAAMALLVIYQVAARYLFNRPPGWTEELARFLQVWLVMLGAPICLRRGMHLAVDYLGARLAPATRRGVQCLVFLFVAVFSLTLTVYGFRLLDVAAMQRSPALGISMVWPYLAVPIGAGIMTFESLRLMVRALSVPAESTQAR